MLELNDVSFAFAEAKTLKSISLQLEPGRVAAIMGESGCGKSTLLNLIYGLLQANEGGISWNKEELLGADHHLVPGHSMMKYVPQEFDLMPYTTVAENVGEHLSIQLENRHERIEELLEVVEMQHYAERKVKTLSGGQKQRVAIAKALAQEPQLLLLDEPFSHVDNFRKNALRRRLFAYLESQHISCLIATHDKDDVLSFTQEVIVLRDGEIIDHRPTAQLYHNPETTYVAGLFDDFNIIKKEMFDLDQEQLCYPHELIIASTGHIATVKSCYFKGNSYLLNVESDQGIFWVSSPESFKTGDIIHLQLA